MLIRIISSGVRKGDRYWFEFRARMNKVVRLVRDFNAVMIFIVIVL